MAKRYVRQTGKDKDGDITRLCNSGQPWSPRAKVDAIRDIENGTHVQRPRGLVSDLREDWSRSVSLF